MLGDAGLLQWLWSYSVCPQKELTATGDVKMGSAFQTVLQSVYVIQHDARYIYSERYADHTS